MSASSTSRRASFERAEPILRVRDLAASVRYYADALGFTPAGWGTATFTAVSRDGAGLYLCEGEQGHAGTWAWLGVDDVAVLYEEYCRSGARILRPPRNYPWAYEMQVEDLDGHVLRIGSEPRGDIPFDTPAT